MTKDEALKLARDWIAERPADRPVSAGKMISIIDRALAQPEQYTDIVSDGGLDPRNKFDAQPEQEPVGFAVMERPWVGLTNEEIENCMCMSIQKTCRAIEAKLKEKNT